MKRTLIVLSVVCLSLSGLAETIVSDVVVNQRWPWSEKVDVDFLVTGKASEIKVTAVWDGQSVPCELGTVSEAKTGWNRVTWDPSVSPFAGRTLTGFSVSVTPFEPPTNRYLIVDLENGGISYAACPDGTGGRWSDDYRTTKMAFRRIPAGTYQLGMESNDIAKVAGYPVEEAYAKAWKRHDVTFTSDFYVGVFKLTGSQYNLLKGESVGDDKKPKLLSYDDLRGEVTSTAINWPTSRYEVAGKSLVDILRAKAGSGLLVDLCQECQWEAAMRAGKATCWPNGGTAEDSLMTLTNLVDLIAWREETHDVGLKDDNGWGLYDPVGMCPEWTLDKCTKWGGKSLLPKYGLSDATDPVGSSTAFANYRVVRGGSGKKLFDLLPCRRQAQSHEDAVAAARFCIHLKPLNFQN